jgi:hypothetical protein
VTRFPLEDLKSLTNSELTKRMDEILRTARSERDPNYNIAYDTNPYVETFFKTARIQALASDKQRKALWMTFDFILQIEYVSRYHGFQNAVLDRQQFDKNGWSSPSLYIAYLSQEQASIVGSRIALERLMDLSYFAANGRELSKGESKFNRFREWLFSLSIDSDWFYLIPYLPWLREHDDEFRTAEVHSGSKLKKYLVSLQDIPNDIKSDAVNLLNILSNLWRYLLMIFNDERPNGAGGIRPSQNLDWLQSYVQRDYSKLESKKKEVAVELGTGVT